MIDVNAHVFNILETVSQVAKKRMVQMLEHSTFANDIPYALGLDHCRDGFVLASTTSNRPME